MGFCMVFDGLLPTIESRIINYHYLQKKWHSITVQMHNKNHIIVCFGAENEFSISFQICFETNGLSVFLSNNSKVKNCTKR